MNLLPYQVDSFNRLVAAVRTYGVGQDSSETGVGKTHVGCATCKELGLRPAVVCPKNLIPVWRRTCQAWGLPEPVFILNYEQIRTGKTSFLSWEQSRRARLASWKVPTGTLLIFDEVHRCAGQNSLNSKMLAAVRRYGIPTLCLSATAAESPLKLKALGYVLRLHDGGESFWKFCTTHGCIKNYWGGVEFPKGTARPGSRLAAQIERARQGLAKLHESIFQGISGNPPKGARVRIADLGDAFPETLITAEAYDFGDLSVAYQNFEQKDAKDAKPSEGEDSPLVAMLRARQAAELLKAPGLAEMAADAVEEGQSVVIFVNFRATLAALRGLIPELSVIEGDTPMDERAAVLRRFGADEVRIVAVNLATAGEGLDGLQDLRGEFPRLTLISPGFSAVQIKQALGRVHRANAKTKSIQRIVFAAGTVEEQACEAVRAKLANMAILNDGDLGEGIAARSNPSTELRASPHPSPLPSQGEGEEFQKPGKCPAD
jgi:superfamily II DNA or RNA helicase